VTDKTLHPAGSLFKTTFKAE